MRLRDGSSPLARGTGRLFRQARDRIRFIPAGAGNRLRKMAVMCRSPVHPRWRGEQSVVLFSCVLHPGSSPLARGTAVVNLGADGVWRFIPAGAGNRMSSKPTLTRWAVHPRWRGEQQTCALRMARQYGSSPLARGTERNPPRHGQPFRFIPAGAGNRWLRLIDEYIQCGSSPLARGTVLPTS